MNPKTFVNRFMFLSVIAGTILAFYVAAKAQTPSVPSPGGGKPSAQIVVEGAAREGGAHAPATTTMTGVPRQRNVSASGGTVSLVFLLAGPSLRRAH